MQTINHFHGYWRFSDQVSLDEITALGSEFAQNPRYLSIYVRGSGKGERILGFIYNPHDFNIDVSESEKAEITPFTDETTDLLKKRFGNGLVGWSISGYYIHIK